MITAPSCTVRRGVQANDRGDRRRHSRLSHQTGRAALWSPARRRSLRERRQREWIKRGLASPVTHGQQRRWPVLESTSRSFPPGHIAWKHPRDVPEATATGRQLALMRGVAARRWTGAKFAVGRLDARRRSWQQGERVRDPLETLLDRVFSLLEDYSMDSHFKEPEDLSDDELKNAVSELLRRHTASRGSTRAWISSISATAFTHRRD